MLAMMLAVVVSVGAIGGEKYNCDYVRKLMTYAPEVAAHILAQRPHYDRLMIVVGMYECNISLVGHAFAPHLAPDLHDFCSSYYRDIYDKLYVLPLLDPSRDHDHDHDHN